MKAHTHTLARAKNNNKFTILIYEDIRRARVYTKQQQYKILMIRFNVWMPVLMIRLDVRFNDPLESLFYINIL